MIGADTVQSNMQAAAELHRRGQLREAEVLYRQVLAADPNHATALGLLGVVAHQTGYCAEAERLLSRAVDLAPQAVALWNNLGVVQMECNRPQEAAVSFRRALELDERAPATLANLGAVDAKVGRFDEAMDHFSRALALSPENPDALTGIGEALFHQSRREEAIAHHRRALARDPDHALAHNNLGKALEHDDPTQAAEHFTRARELRPDLMEAWTNLAGIVTRQGQPTQALGVLQRALEINPRSADAHHAMARALMSAGRVRESIAHRRQAVALDPDNDVVHSGLLWALSYDESAKPQAVFEEHLAWAARVDRPLTALAGSHDHHDRDRDRPLRIGYVSGDFRDHAVAHFIEPVLRHHDPAAVDVFCYTTSPRSDHVTERLRAFARGGWRDITNLTDERSAEMIAADRIDILIDLAGHTKGGRLRLFARRPAPVQATWVGYCATTGLRAVDYWITDGLVDPPGQPEPFAAEKLMRLPHTLACYRPPDDAPAVADAPPITRNGFVTFGSFNRAAKLNDRVVDAWSQILLAVENSRLLLVFPSLQDVTVLEEIAQRFIARGLPRDRLDIRPTQPMKEYLLSHNDVDIVLDPFPFTGHTTTLHTLWMGVPVLTLAGQTHVSRRGVSVMTNLGLTDWIASSPQDYVAIAVSAAGDVARLTQLRRELRNRMLASPLMNYDEFVRDVERAFRAMWQTWCDLR